MYYELSPMALLGSAGLSTEQLRREQERERRRARTAWASDLADHWLRHEFAQLAARSAAQQIGELSDLRFKYNIMLDRTELWLRFEPNYGVSLMPPRELQQESEVLRQISFAQLADYWRRARHMTEPDSPAAAAAPAAPAVNVRPAVGIRPTDRVELDFRRPEYVAVQVMYGVLHAAATGNADAEQRGEELLRSFLSPEQLQQYETERSFICIGSHTRKQYRIIRGNAYNVEELNHYSNIKRRLCFVPTGAVCIADTMLAQKITLECDEPRALSVANVCKAPASTAPLDWSRPRRSWRERLGYWI